MKSQHVFHLFVCGFFFWTGLGFYLGTSLFFCQVPPSAPAPAPAPAHEKRKMDGWAIVAGSQGCILCFEVEF
jgi:hypothetical protein